MIIMQHPNKEQQKTFTESIYIPFQPFLFQPCTNISTFTIYEFAGNTFDHLFY